MYSEEDVPFMYRLPARQRSTANAILDGRMHQLQSRVTDQLSYTWPSCNTSPCSTTSLFHAFGHLNQSSFLDLTIGIFIGCSLVTLTVQPSTLLVLTVNREFARSNTKLKMSLFFLDKATRSVLNGDLSKHR